MKDFFEKLSGSQPLTVILILGAVFIVLGALGGIPINAPIQAIDNWTKVIFLILGTTLLLFGLVRGISSAKTEGGKRKNIYGLTLDTPASSDKDAVLVEGQHPKFSGSYKNKPSFGEFALIVYDHSWNRFWPQDPTFITWGQVEDGRWQGSVMLGAPGEERTILAVLLPPSGQVLLNYFKKHGEKVEWAPFETSIPDDFVVVGKVRVIRSK